MTLSREQEGCVSTTKHSLTHTKCHRSIVQPAQTPSE